MPLVLAYHLIMATYGFWLPNDPRGLWSDFVRSWEPFLFGGPATRTRERRSIAREPHDVAKRLEAKGHLVREPVALTGLQARAVARGFANCVDRSGLVVYVCSILPKHVHLVVNRHTCLVEQVARLLKGAATSDLLREGLHPPADAPYRDGSIPTPWSRHAWSVFLDDDATIRRAVRYTRRNSEKDGKAPQDWSFVSPFAGVVV